MHFRKKPVVIEAFRISDLIESATHNWSKLPEWVKTSYEAGNIVFAPTSVSFLTPHGLLITKLGDWVVHGENDTIYSVKPGVFETDYEEVEDEYPSSSSIPGIPLS